MTELWAELLALAWSQRSAERGQQDTQSSPRCGALTPSRSRRGPRAAAAVTASLVRLRERSRRCERPGAGLCGCCCALRALRPSRCAGLVHQPLLELPCSSQFFCLFGEVWWRPEVVIQLG